MKVQSIRPQTHHGKQLHEMFCFSFDRPNCLGGKLAAEHLLDYTRQFISTYDRGDENASAHAKPWAAFISFIDSHEDSLTLISYLDGILLKFLQDVPRKNTMIVFTSDHGELSFQSINLLQCIAHSSAQFICHFVALIFSMVRSSLWAHLCIEIRRGGTCTAITIHENAFIYEARYSSSKCAEIYNCV